LLAILGIQLRFLTGRLEYRILAIFKISSHNDLRLRLLELRGALRNVTRLTMFFQVVQR
jgi:hypothetical protein